MDYERVVRAFLHSCWAIREEKLQEIAAFLSAKANGLDVTGMERREPPVAKIYAAQSGEKGARAVAVLPIHDVIVQRSNIMTEFSGGVSLEMATAQLRDFVANPQIGAVVLDIDSPGGSVFGLPEFGEEVRQARATKPIVAVADAMAASAAYWIASQADEVVVTPSGEVGSIGVIAFHEDISKFLEDKGIKTTMIKAGKFKGEGWPEFPLSEEARDYQQQQVDAYYDMFVKAVASGRAVKQSDVREGFGQGRMVMAQQAVKIGMADRIATLDETIDRMGRQQEAGGARRARAEEPERDTDRPEVIPIAAGNLSDEDRQRRLRMF